MRHCLLPALPLALALLAGCATAPESIPDPGPDSPDLATVRAAPDAARGATVRWGGTIAGVENRSGATLVEIVARDLDSLGRPREGDGSPGRFLARIDGFLDPAIHETGRSMTVTGTVDGVVMRPVGEHDYPYIRVRADGYHLWPERTVPRYPRDPFYRPGPFYDPWYHPWYDPWYPYRPGYRYH